MTINTKLINFFSGPNSGKTATMSGVFSHLKKYNLKVEISHEVAKPYVFEKRFDALNCQPLISGEQIWHIERLMGQVDIILTDAPILQGIVYGKNATGTKYPDSFYQFLIDQHKKFGGDNFFIRRGEVYDTTGRTQSFDEAIAVDKQILDLLDSLEETYSVEDLNWGTAEYITSRILRSIKWRQDLKF